MHHYSFPMRPRLLITFYTLVVLLMLLFPATASARSTSGGFYQQTNLTSDISGKAQFTDKNLVNPWGISFAPGGPFWVSDEGTGLSTLYNGSGKPQPLIVTIPPAPGGTVGTPTGTVYNSTPGFVVTENGKSGASLFLFDSLDGTISGWSPGVDATHAIIAVNNSGKAVYTGLAIGNNRSGTFLYAANFAAGTIDVFDKNFAPATLHGSFKDASIPAGYAPFNIQLVGSNLYVMYARQDRKAGVGNGFVNIFDTNGNFIKRLISHSKLNLPWGVAMAPANFGQFSNDLLVGNFGNGRIHAFDPSTGAFLGTLDDSSGKPIVNGHLWTLVFGNGGQGGQTNQLFFTAGIQNEQHGLFGILTAM
ncbi:MAG TPA: TIGR03118 family protein [Ktedonobacteraceae bacterium]|nr:TIGR03118 family protein [Ktedonobacteraceae bacterium]